MRIVVLTPLLLLTVAHALPILTFPWLGQLRLFGSINRLDSSPADEERTIYQVLKENPDFSRLVKAVELSDKLIEYLNDPSLSITFFAVPNSGLPRHGKHGGHAGIHSADISESACHSINDLAQLVFQAEQLDHLLESDDKETHKRCLAHIVQAIIAYHILPERHNLVQLSQNSTFATHLTLRDGSMDHQPLRISIRRYLLSPWLNINGYAKITKRDTEVKNGVIHQINHPLVPPPSIFQEVFLFPKAFSFVTSAIQRVGLTSAIDRWYVHGEHGTPGSYHGARTVTFFAPESKAFQHLPKKLRLFLFSPFGEKALKKLLEYHIVPDFTLFSDFLHNATSENTLPTKFSADLQRQTGFVALESFYDAPVSDHPVEGVSTGFTLVYEFDITLPTLLDGHSLDIHVARYQYKFHIPGTPRYFTKFKVNGKDLHVFDIPARNGALHAVPVLLDPRKGAKCPHHKEHCKGEHAEAAWENWEDWLPQWASEI